MALWKRWSASWSIEKCCICLRVVGLQLSRALFSNRKLF
jgi:hypothetical protein